MKIMYKIKRIINKILVVINCLVSGLKGLLKKLFNSLMLVSLDKLIALLLGALFLSSLKYAISGNFSIN